MRKLLLTIALLFSGAAGAQDKNPDAIILPTAFKVYYLETIQVATTPFTGATEAVLPTINAYDGTPGCYIACYSHHQEKSVYPVSKNVFMMGQIRVPGHYVNKVCQPKGFENQDISALPEFKTQCEKTFATGCNQLGCWAGGDTGSWF